MPNSPAMAAAVAGWSPVIMIGRMPALLAAGHGGFGLFAGRIDHAHQTQHDQFAFLVRPA